MGGGRDFEKGGEGRGLLKRLAFFNFASDDLQTPTQPYVKRNRPTGYSPSATITNEMYANAAKLGPSNGLTAVRAALSQQQRNTDDVTFIVLIPLFSIVTFSMHL